MRQKQKVPIENVPTARARCVGCGKLLKPLSHDTWQNCATVPGETREEITRRVFTRWDAYNGLFHSLRCALQFATMAYGAGYRVTSNARDKAAAT